MVTPRAMAFFEAIENLHGDGVRVVRSPRGLPLPIQVTFSSLLGVWEREDQQAQARFRESGGEAYASLDVKAQLTRALQVKLEVTPHDFA